MVDPRPGGRAPSRRSRAGRIARVSSRRLAPVVVLATALAGCGNSRTPPPDVSTPAAPSGEKTLTSKREGVRMDVPGNWAAAVGPAPLAIRTASGAATLSLWRYPRTEPLPEDPTALRAAQRRLVTEVERHDKTVQISSAKVLRISGAPAVQLVA